ncbi:MAG: helix-turn-helix domain-containing protein [Faecalibacterium sp.]|nr:helix-turn-helix domain-containing protein [Faecalibacterium sp.]
MKDSAAERRALSLQVGQRIRTIRKQRGLSLEALALKCDMNAAFLGHIERGLRCPTLYTLERISTGLEINIVELFLDSCTELSNAVAVQHFSDAISALSPSQVEQVLSIVDHSVALTKAPEA